jgi:toxin ParE1/3/4
MQEYKLKILVPAMNELLQIADNHLMLVGPVSAKKITDLIFDSLEKLKQFPLSGAPIWDDELATKGYRVVVCKKYIAVYRLIKDTVYVYHIVHGATDYPKLFN